MPTLNGRVQSVVFGQAGFYILAFEQAEGSPRIAKVRGNVHGLMQVKAGTPLSVSGRWDEHPKFGRQLVIERWTPWANTPSDVYKFLHECVDGFLDQTFARAVSTEFGTAAFETMTKDPEAVYALTTHDPPIPEATIKHGLECWQRLLASQDLAVLMEDHGIDSSMLQAVLERFGTEAARIISENPYRLLLIQGFDFLRADKIALKVGLHRDDPKRLEGAILWLLRLASQEGHLYVRRGDLQSMLSNLVQDAGVEPFDVPDIGKEILAAIDRMARDGAVLVDPEAGVYLSSLYEFERESAKLLASALTPVKLDVDLGEFLPAYEKANAIELSEAQREAVEKLIQNRVLALTGLPGTGKTTVVKTFVRLFEAAKLSFVLMAPTGIAAKRLASVCGHEAGTIHRTLKCDGVNWGHHRNNRFVVDAIIVDEMSMVDQELFFRLLDALQPQTMLVFVGDDAQLPSVGPGSVLRELTSSPDVPHVRLTQIFRQTETSDIVLNSHRINAGEMLPLEKDPDSEFQFVALADQERIADLIVSMAEKLKSRDANFQVMSPKYDGPVGVNNLNDRLREKLNPGGIVKEWKAKHLHVREGDRLMVIKNDYELNIYNGDMGKLTSIEKESLVVKIHGIGANGVATLVRIPKDRAPELLKLAYAITVHKSQGSEFDTIILPIVRAQGRMLQRNLFYTAVTRAKKKAWIIGEPGAVQKAILNDKVVQRNTAFGAAISRAVLASSGVRAGNGEPHGNRPEEASR